MHFSALAVTATYSQHLALYPPCLPQTSPRDTPVSVLLASAQTHLSKGETSDAVDLLRCGNRRDPTDYLTFFKRATTYLSMGRTLQATDDFNKVLSLRPGFEGAHVQLAKIKGTQCRLEMVRASNICSLRRAQAPRSWLRWRRPKARQHLPLLRTTAGNWDGVREPSVHSYSASRPVSAASPRDARSLPL